MTQALPQLVLNIPEQPVTLPQKGNSGAECVFTRLRWRADHHISSIAHTGLTSESASLFTHHLTLRSRAGPEVAQHLLQHGARRARRWVACAHGGQVPPELSARHLALRAQALLTPSAHTAPRAIPCTLLKALLRAPALSGQPAALTALACAAATLSCSWGCVFAVRWRSLGFRMAPRRHALRVFAPRQQHRQCDAHAPVQTCAVLWHQNACPVIELQGTSSLSRSV